MHYTLKKQYTDSVSSDVYEDAGIDTREASKYNTREI